MTDAPQAQCSPLTPLVGHAPDAAFAVLRGVQRAAFSIVGVAMRVPLVAVRTLVDAPVVRGPLENLETHVGAIATRGAAQRRHDVGQVGAFVRRVEPAVARVFERAVDLLPIEALLARVDVDALVRGVDVDALITRIDLPRLVSEVLAGIELGDLIHDSTTSIAADARDTVRVQAMSVDGRLAALVDRLVRRRRERDLVVPGFTFRGAT